MAPQVGVIECEHRHLVKAFGQPSFSVANGDDFDGIETCAWHIEFERGQTVRISGIKEKIRDANPNG